MVDKTDQYINLEQYDGSILTPKSNLVYKQWQKDSSNDLLIDGYCRRSGSNKSHEQPKDIKDIIKLYYLKKYSKSEVAELINQRELSMIYKKERRKREIHDIWYAMKCIYFLAIILLLAVISPDIVALKISSNNDCNLMKSNYINFSVTEWLQCGCIINIIYMSISCVIVTRTIDVRCDWAPWFLIIGSIMCCIALFIFSWSIIGFILYSEMDTNTISNKTCSNMVLSWSILRVIESISIPGIPFLIWLWFIWVFRNMPQ
eukprot:119222_1